MQTWDGPLATNSASDHQFYHGNSFKGEFSGFARGEYRLRRLDFMADLQLRSM